MNTNRFDFWKPPEANKKLKFCIWLLHLILILLYPLECLQTGVFPSAEECQQFFYSIYSYYCFYWECQLKVVFVFFKPSLWSFDKWHSFIPLFSTQLWVLVCVRILSIFCLSSSFCEDPGSDSIDANNFKIQSQPQVQSMATYKHQIRKCRQLTTKVS